MGEALQPLTLGFNRSLRVESRTDRLTGDPVTVLLREIMEQSGIISWMTARLKDRRSQVDVTHDLASLIRTSVLLAAQGWRDHDDADVLRHDPAFQLAASSSAGLTPLGGPGLASQPTLSRFTALLAAPGNLQVLREAVLEMAGRGIRAERGGKRARRITLDVDSAPIEVHGHQPRAEWNGHYTARIYHPLITSIAETGDMLMPGSGRAKSALRTVRSTLSLMWWTGHRRACAKSPWCASTRAFRPQRFWPGSTRAGSTMSPAGAQTRLSTGWPRPT